MQRIRVRAMLCVVWGMATIVMFCALLSARVQLCEARGLLSGQFRLLVRLEAFIQEDNWTSFNEWSKYMQSVLLQYILRYDVQSVDAYWTLPEYLENSRNTLTQDQRTQIDAYLSNMETFDEFGYARFERNVLMRLLPLFSDAERWAIHPRQEMCFTGNKMSLCRNS
jgi:hypothetical protein